MVSLEEGLGADCVSEVSQYSQGGFSSQIYSLFMEIMMRGEERGGAVFVDSSSGAPMSTVVHDTSMAAFAWKKKDCLLRFKGRM